MFGGIQLSGRAMAIRRFQSGTYRQRGNHYEQRICRRIFCGCPNSRPNVRFFEFRVDRSHHDFGFEQFRSCRRQCQRRFCYLRGGLDSYVLFRDQHRRLWNRGSEQIALHPISAGTLHGADFHPGVSLRHSEWSHRYVGQFYRRRCSADRLSGGSHIDKRCPVTCCRHDLYGGFERHWLHRVCRYLGRGLVFNRLDAQYAILLLDFLL